MPMLDIDLNVLKGPFHVEITCPLIINASGNSTALQCHCQDVCSTWLFTLPRAVIHEWYTRINRCLTVACAFSIYNSLFQATVCVACRPYMFPVTL